jgi:glycosyltransferase involved in cell wall biosynthesis
VNDMKNGRVSPSVYHQFLVSRDLGGAGLVALHLAKFFAAAGREAPVWAPGPGAAWGEAERLGLTVHSYDLPSAFSRSALAAAGANWRVWRGLRGSAGLAHVHSPGVYGALRHALRLSGLRSVAHVQIEEEPALLRWAFASPPDLIITCAHFLVGPVRQALPEHRRERQRIAAVPNAVDTAKFAPGDKAEARRKVGAPAGAPLALMLANLAPHKGQETAIRAVAALKARGVEAHLWLAGTERGGAGAYTARLRALAGEAGAADRVHLLGQCRDTPDLLRAADFFLLPSTCEGLPLSVLEAQAAKVPVLAAPTAGVPEVVRDGATGFLIPADDAAGYATRMEQLLADRALARRVTEAAYRDVTREHNWPAYCQRVAELYDEILEGGAARDGARAPGARRRPLSAAGPEPCRAGGPAR